MTETDGDRGGPAARRNEPLAMARPRYHPRRVSAHDARPGGAQGEITVTRGLPPGDGTSRPRRQTVDHPWFSRLYPLTERALDRIMGRAREAQNVQAVGRTLIIGAVTMRRIVAQRHPSYPAGMPPPKKSQVPRRRLTPCSAASCCAASQTLTGCWRGSPAS